MDNNMLYWIIEYVKVLLGYGFLMFVWPLTIFRKYLRNKSVTFKFGFCISAQVVIVNTVVLMLGLVHILNDWTLRILFYGSFLYSIRHCFALTKERKTKIKYLVHGSYGFKNFVWLECRKYVRKWENVWARFTAFYRKHWLEYSLLIVALVYGVIYFSWGTFHDKSFGFSDIYVHHQWIYELSEGKPFSAGIYPEGMHCIIYALNALFGIKIYNCLLFVSLANVVMSLLAIYCLLKEIFKWRLSSVLALMIFLTLGAVANTAIITCMSRLQCALPQEFAFPEMFLCTLFLIRYLKSHRGTVIKGKKTKLYWNENLVVFGLALASTIAIHFYATMMAFFLCIGVAITLIKRIFTKERFLPLVTSAFLGVMIALIPMGAAFASGIQLQGSLYWAMGVMDFSSEDSSESTPEIDIPVQDSSEQESKEYEDDISADKKGDKGENIAVVPPDDSNDILYEEKTSLQDKLVILFDGAKEFAIKIWNTGKVFFSTLYYGNLRFLFEVKVANLFAACHVLIFIVSVMVFVMKIILGKLFHYESVLKIDFSGYIILLFASFVYAVVYCASDLDLPVLIDNTRIGTIIFLLDVALVVAILDIMFYMACIIISERILMAVSLLATVGILANIITSEYYHGFLYFQLSRVGSTVQITNQIIDELPEESFTIVSPTEELFQVIEYGYHEEIVTFLKNQQKENYILPTKYVFVFVEKKPVEYVQIQGFSGPKWLAGNRYFDVMYCKPGASVWPKYIGTKITIEEAEKPLMYFGTTSGMYTNLESRIIIESKMYYWCQAFKERYPNEVKVYYEDDCLVCYYWEQNPERPYNLVIK